MFEKESKRVKNVKLWSLEIFQKYYSRYSNKMILKFSRRLQCIMYITVQSGKIKRSLKTGNLRRFFFHVQEFNLRSWIVMDMKVVSQMWQRKVLAQKNMYLLGFWYSFKIPRFLERVFLKKVLLTIY